MNKKAYVIRKVQLVVRKGRVDELTNTATTQAQNQDYKLAHANIYPVCDLLENVKGPVL